MISVSHVCLSRRAASHYPPSASAASPEPMRILSRSYRQVVPSRSVRFDNTKVLNF